MGRLQSMTMDEMIGRLAQLIGDNQPCVVLTGAGISTVNHEPESWVARMG
jgi:hypothetical protein